MKNIAKSMQGITFLLLPILIISSGCERQEKIDDEFKLKLSISNWEGYECVISIDGLKNKRITTIQGESEIKNGNITIEDYNTLIDSIKEIDFFSIRDLVAHYPYSRANHYNLYIKYNEMENEFEFYPTNHKGLDLLTEKIKSITNSDLGWN